MIESFLVQKDRFYVISKLNGAVVCPKFQFGLDGYVDNYLNNDFFRWDISNREKRVMFFDPLGELTACFDCSNLLENQEVIGLWYRHNIKIRLKLYQGNDSAVGDHKLFIQLRNTKWRFLNNKGQILSNNFHLCEDGFVRGYQHSNETSWRIVNGQLYLFSSKHEVSHVFYLPTIEADTPISLKGNFVLRDKSIIHRLELISGEGSYCLGELNSELILKFANSTLFVHFNGHANRFNGNKTNNWEFSSLSAKYTADVCRFSSGFVASWYLDSINNITSILSGIIDRYKQVVFVGMSAGGYISLYMSERFARLKPNIKFISFSFNPQTTHELSDRRFMLESYSPDIRANIASDFIINHKKQIDNTDINQFFSEELFNLEHFVFHDSGNESEAFYVDRLNKTKRLNIYGYNLGLSHFEGTPEVFYKSLDVVYKTLDDRLGC